jgi:TonB family protein
MPALWSPEDLAARFAPYIEELHDVFAMHGLHYGSPDNIGQLTERLQKPGLLNEELAALVRSMVLREGGSIPRTDLLEIVAIAIAGPRMNPAGEELQPAVKQLLSFLHTALRRPWNEPPGEERLHPDEDPRAEAARELREAAAKIEAEVQGAGCERRTEEVEAHGEVAAHAARANVIPFGRARAVFSRLARAEAADQMDDDEPHEDQAVVAASGVQNQLPQPSMPPTEITDTMPIPVPSVQVHNPVVYDQPVEHAAREAVATFAAGTEDQTPALSPVPDEISSPSAITDVTATLVPAMQTEMATEAPPVQPAAAQQEPQLPALHAAETAEPPSMAAFTAQTEPIRGEGNSAVPDAVSVVATPSRQKDSSPQNTPAADSDRRQTPPPIAPPEFDEEPPLPAVPHISRNVFVYGIAAVVLLAAVLGFALRTRTATEAASDSSSTATIRESNPAEALRKPQAAVLPAPAVPNDAGSKPSPATDLSGSTPAHESHFDDDYIAPPYSNTPAQPDAAAVSVPQPASESSAPPASKMEEISAPQASQTHFELARPRDPDASIVGDSMVRTSVIALAEPPRHPHISAGLMAQNLVSGPKPDYPALAKFAHVDGPVVLHAEINRSGVVSDTQVISGHFLLRRAAEAAVRHWRYRPYQVDGKPVSVSTTITVRFRH